MLKTYFRFRGESTLRAGFSDFCYLSGTSKGKKKKKDCALSPKPCWEALSQISHMRMLLMEQAQSHLKGWFILEFIKLVEKKKLSFLFLRVAELYQK